MGDSSTGGGRLDLAPIFALGEEAKYDDVRRMAGDRGGVAPPTPCNELRDVRLCNVGVEDRSLPPRELELGVLRRGVRAERVGMEGDAVPSCSWFIEGGTTGEDGGRAVAAAEESESRSILSESKLPSLFVD